ncbi:MAG TPA: hypothetical protein VMZ92_12125, partial [Planctomycetota bacterium]|nr:hypothetical protein [Planctomycetota bacterium]
MASYYVRTSGDDTKDGLSDATGHALATLAAAEAKATTGGDIIYVANGFDSAGEIAIPGESIIYRAYRSTEEPSDVPPAINGALDLVAESWTREGATNRCYFDLTAGSGHANDNIAYLRFKYYALQIQYAGAGTGAAAVTATGVTLTYGAGGTVSTFTFNDYPTLGSIVTAMHALTNWTCTRPFMASDYPSSGLAVATYADVKTTAVRFTWAAGAAGSKCIGGKKIVAPDVPAALGEYSIATDGAAGTRVTIFLTDGTIHDPAEDFTAVEVFWSDCAVSAAGNTITLNGITLKGFGGYTATRGVSGTASAYAHNCIIVHEAKVPYSYTDATMLLGTAVAPVAIGITGNGTVEMHNCTVIGGFMGTFLNGNGNTRATNNLFIGLVDYPLVSVGSGVITHGDNRVYGWYGYSGKSYISRPVGGSRVVLGGDTWDDDPRKLALGTSGWEWPAAMANGSLDPTYPYTDAFDDLASIQGGLGRATPLAIGALPSGEGWTGGLAAAAAGYLELVAAGSEVVSMGTTRQCYADAATLIPQTSPAGAFAAFVTNPGVAFTLTTTLGSTSATMTIDQTAGTFVTAIDAAGDVNINLAAGGILSGHSAALDGYMSIAELVDVLNGESASAISVRYTPAGSETATIQVVGGNIVGVTSDASSNFSYALGSGHTLADVKTYIDGRTRWSSTVTGGLDTWLATTLDTTTAATCST